MAQHEVSIVMRFVSPYAEGRTALLLFPFSCALFQIYHKHLGLATAQGAQMGGIPQGAAGMRRKLSLALELLGSVWVPL